jgi:hypothetical protein
MADQNFTTESAFPQVETVFYEDGERLERPRIQSYGGMQLRDWFAGQAIIGLLTRHQDVNTTPTDSSFTSAVLVADFAYKIADAMMGIREAEKA